MCSSCLLPNENGKVKLNLSSLDQATRKRGGSTEQSKITINQVELINDQIIISGSDLDGVTLAKVSQSGSDSVLAIISKTSDQLILSSASSLVLALNTLVSFTLEDAYGAATIDVTFNLPDSSVGTSKIGDGAITAVKLSDMGAGIGQILKYDGSSWVPGDLSSLTYAGNWNASGAALSDGNLGEFYIVNVAGSTDLAGGPGTNSWAVGDWAVWNDVQSRWEKIDNATNVQSFKGRSGVVVPALNDYTWAQIDKSSSAIGDIADVDLTTPATNGQVLKFSCGVWVASDDLSSGGAGSGSSAEIADGSIVNADINAAAAIDQSKISNLTTDLAA